MVARNKWSKLVEAMPQPFGLAASLFLHAAALTAIILLRHVQPAHIQPATYGTKFTAVVPTYLPATPKAIASRGRPATPHARRPPLRRSGPVGYGGEIVSDEVVQEQAQRWTSAITMSLNFHGVYRNHVYELAVLISGDLPVVSEAELPPHFQSYVIVEVTIDATGRPAVVRKVAGVTTPAIEQRMVSAIREFRYIPAKRDGIPVPSQRDIVIHIPT